MLRKVHLDTVYHNPNTILLFRITCGATIFWEKNLISEAKEQQHTNTWLSTLSASQESQQQQGLCHRTTGFPNWEKKENLQKDCNTNMLKNTVSFVLKVNS